MGDRITSLPADVRSLLRTGVTITHVAQCVEELVVNALDAGATCVATRVDLPCFKVQVVDNGRGIRYDDLNLIGERYATSKCHEVNDLENLRYYGYRGEALASLRDITSVLEINSRSQNSTQTYCKIFQQRKSIQISDSTIPRSSSGTTITVYDLFYNLPVRKKCCNPSLDLEKVRQKIEGIALIKPAVSFSLRNDVTGNVILQTHKTNSILNTFTYLFSPARSKSLTEVDGKEGNFSVQGYIGKSGSNKKDYQFIYINGRLVLKTKLHKTVNRQLSKSLILRKKLELTSNRFRGHIMTTSPTKTTDQHAIFVLNVVCPYKEYDITFEPAKTLVEFKDFEVLQHCLENMITDFLKRENLHLGILMENFGKKEVTKSPSNGNNSDEEIDEVKDQDQNVGLKLKPEIRTTDRNGLFSKVVKRKIIPETVVDRDGNCDSQSSSSDTREIIATENNDPNTSGELNVKVLQKGNSETNKTVNSKSSSTNTLDNLKTPQNKIAVLNLCPNIHVPDNSENKNVDQELSGNKQNDPHVIIENDVDDEEKIYVTSRDSCSEGELSEDPLPTEQRKQPLPQRKQLICIDTPIVRQAKINISALSKLRKRKSTEDCTSLAKNLEKHQKFTKLKEMDRDDSLGGEKTKGNLLLRERSIEKTTISNEGEVNENNPTHNSESIMTSSLQGLRKFRAKENKSNANIEGNNNGHSLKYSLQELRKHRVQTASTGNCDRTKGDSFKDILQDRNLTGTSFSTSKNISEKVVRFDENKHMELDSRQPDQSESRQRLLDSIQSSQSESRQRLLDSIQSGQSESRQRLLDSIQSSQSESRQRLLDSRQPDQSESRQRLLDSIQSSQSESRQTQLDNRQSDQSESKQRQLDSRQPDQSESRQRLLDSIQSSQSESRQTQLDNRQSDQSESKQRQLDSRQSDQSESRQRHNAGDSESCENDQTNLLKREDNKFSEFIENKRKSTTDNLSFSNASEMFVDLPPGPDSYKESSGLKENCRISKHPVQAQTTMVSQKQMGILSNDSGNISSPIDIDEACQSLENCITEIENVISSSEKEREIATDMSQQIPTSLLTATVFNSGDGIGSNVFANRTKSFMSSDQMIQTAQTFMEKYEDDQKRDSVEKCEKNKSNNNMSQDLQMDMKKQAAPDIDIRYVAQSILHSNKLFNVDDRVQASESLGTDSSSESMTQDMFSSDCSQGELPSCSYRKAKSFETSKSRTRNADNFMSENSYQQELNNRSMFTLTEHNLNLSKAMNSLENKERVLPSQSISFLSYFDVDGFNNLPGTQQKSEITTVQDTKLPFEIYLKHMQKNVKMTSSDETDDFLLCRESMKEIDESQICFGQTQEFLVAEDSGIVTEYKDMDTSDTEENEIGIEFVHNVPVFERKMTISPCLSEGFSPAMDTENDIDSTGSKNVEEMMTPVELSNTCRQYMNSSLNKCLSSLKDYADSRTEVPLSPQNKVSCIDVVPTISESAASVDSTRPYFSSAKFVQSESLHQSESKGERLSGTRLTCKKLFEDISGSSNSERTTICSGSTFDKSAELFSNYSLTRHQNSDTSSSCLESQNKHVHTENNLKSQNVSDSQISNIMISHRSEVHNEGFIKTASNMENKVSNAHSNEEMMSSEKCEDENNDEEMFSLDGDREICEISHQAQSNDKMTGVVTSTPCSARKGDTDELFSPDGDCQLRDVQYESKTWIEMTDPRSGNKLYVNTRSGHSISSDVWTPPDEDTAVAEKEDINSTDLNRQCSPTELSPGSSKVLKDMMSHHLSKEDDELKSIKWKDSTQINTDSRKVEDLFDKWENPVFTMAPQNLPSTQFNHMSRASTKAYQALNPCVFDKDMLNKFKVLGQVDNKFIACSLEGGNSGEEMLVLIDQHAAHERIRLEDLTKEAYEMTDGVKVICQSELTTDVELTFPEEVVRVMTSFVEDFKTIGIKFSVDKNKRDSVILHTLPSCILQKDSFDGKKKKDTTAIKAAQNLIKEYVEVLQDTRGSRGRLPSTIHKVLCSQACHGAIKFGDPLTLTECKDLLKSLTKCKLPFQCAHGRPSVVPLIQLQNKRQERKRPNLWKIARNIQH